MTTLERTTQQHHRTSYVPHTEHDRREMLATIGVGSIEELFADIPAALRNPSLALPPGQSELEVLTHLEQLAERNQPVDRLPSFLGAGAYRHFIPSAVWQLVGRNEFYTSYTPYQPEVSQGTLQAMYEFQSFVALLTGMEVANASVYDGASGLAEAALMAVRLTGRRRVAVAENIHPDYQQTVATYLVPQGIAVDRFDPEAPPAGEAYACLAIQQPSFEGFLVPAERVATAAHAGGALLVVSADLLSLGLLRPPGDYGADIVVGEAQSCGVPLQFGGPYVGIFACRAAYLRQLPGRLVGATVDQAGRRGYVLTLQAREQHIRRERATSNICTSQGLIALAVTIYLSLLGESRRAHGRRTVLPQGPLRCSAANGDPRLPAGPVGTVLVRVHSLLPPATGRAEPPPARAWHHRRARHLPADPQWLAPLRDRSEHPGRDRTPCR
ncbi:MAG: glycine dehydrogenase [Dehalococcoidia bacterium]|nr:MAG: glycine dehydrogenase [Dehalococcoidia bacterium]